MLFIYLRNIFGKKKPLKGQIASLDNSLWHFFLDFSRYIKITSSELNTQIYQTVLKILISCLLK